MTEVRQRKPNAPAAPAADEVDDKKDKKTAAPASGYDVGIVSVAVAVVSILALTGLAIAAVLHFLDPLQYLDLPNTSTPSSSINNNDDSSNPGLRTFTPTALAAHSGTDPALPLLLAINGTVHDVSAGRPFYGPGGPYAHFSGRDATRAWVTECFTDGLTAEERSDDAFASAQLVADARGLEKMFAPLWLDEALQDAADGAPVAADAAALFPAANVPPGTTLPEHLREQARKALARMPGGRVGEEERAERREADEREAREAVERALGKWVQFFGASGKYPVVGRMASEGGEEEEKGEPPALCEKARKKRPIKGGRLEPMMGMMQKMMGGAGAGAGAGAAGAGAGQKGSPGQMPDFVKQMLEQREKEKKGKP
ncbi:hypothetical protein SLS56_009611 [Neofusicoccum ribis]|uniref:Cytochrome b5 heme-binding domain-containing protein n=1 Tax=Neofusicoccum ribis TaxID=45134 RepID=A0ABR3SGV5_9PEZI